MNPAYAGVTKFDWLCLAHSSLCEFFRFLGPLCSLCEIFFLKRRVPVEISPSHRSPNTINFVPGSDNLFE